jgi:hypothetical protein
MTRVEDQRRMVVVGIDGRSRAYLFNGGGGKQ